MDRMKDENKKVRARYNRVSAFYDPFEYLIERLLFSEWRREFIGQVHGKVLEVGVGTGKNLPYYPKDVDLTAIDVSPHMMKRARKRAQRLDIDVDLKIADAQEIQSDDDQFDYVVMTFVLCSIPDPVKALKRIKRVLKPEGELIAVEHVLSKYPIIRAWEKIHNPVMVRLFGFNVNRDTRGNIEKAGFQIAEDRKLALKDVFRMFRARIPPKRQRSA